ncbi:MAG: diphthine--ammonia ligase [Nanoarchaeota archaeon]|nr:TIGR00289 family protein [Nanoarchaeota archaeon]MBU4452493.1 TIGR00289 family protein [Nanoarchaeota archaeon]MCG2723430.1 TIGR00289 family protein [archaeon]
MKLAALISGGKDSIFAIYAMKQKGHEITYILTMMPARSDSYMFHHPNVHLTAMQADLMNIPQITGKTKGEKEKELKDLENLIATVKGKVDGIVTGALYSNYQKERIDAIAKKLGLKSEAPLWNIDLVKYWDLLLENKFEVVITAVAAEGLDKSWLGRKLDKKAVNELIEISKKNKINIAGEGGEFETFVLDCPLFSKKIELIEAHKEWKRDAGVYIIECAKTVPK